MGIVVTILIIEARSEDRILQEIISLLSKKAEVRNLLLPVFTPCAEKDTQSSHTLTFPDLEIQTREQCVYKNGNLIPLSHYEFAVLSFLTKHPGWVFSKEQIYEAVWKEPGEDCNATIANVISRIRKKLNPENPKESCIKTVVNGGYKFEPQAEA